MKITNWDNHWKEINNDPLVGVINPRNWSDFQWFHTLYMLDLQINHYKKNMKCISMLECGAGTAAVTRYFKKKYNFDNTILDNSIEALKISEMFINKDNLKINSILCDIKNMPFENNSFDIVFLGGVMEYLEDYDLCVEEIKRVLKPGGLLLFVVVPNVFNIQILGDIFLFLKNKISKKQTKLVPSNVKKWYANTYIKILKNNGFVKTKYYYLNPFPQIPLPNTLKKIYNYLIYNSEFILKKYNRSQFIFKKYLSISFLIVTRKIN
jgi:ubiquinone/menaquinone biosynthesis C-methylase UbiE